MMPIHSPIKQTRHPLSCFDQKFGVPAIEQHSIWKSQEGQMRGKVDQNSFAFLQPKWTAPLINKNSSIFMPTLVDSDHYILPNSNFVPVLTENEECVRSTTDDADREPAKVQASPALGAKGSPSPSLKTTTTIDSIESLYMTIDSPNTSPSVNLLSSSNLSNWEVSKIQPPRVWVPPRDISVCKIINTIDNNELKGRKSQSPRDAPKNRRKEVSPQIIEEDDSNRKTRIKTELCLHYINKTTCPFGSNCTYAHGEEELQLTKLMDLHRAGLVDVETYRTKPCLTWVSTGSCPFGKRCHSIHDPRVAGSVQSWLPHTETQGNTIATDINVDALYQKRLYSILHNNPFGVNFNPVSDSFEAFCNMICDSSKTQSVKAKKRIAEEHKIAIALKMRGSADFSYKFRPQHIIHDELCMVLQKRAFRITQNDDVVNIPMTMYNPRSKQDVVVREIAFGPDSDPSARGVALVFNIDEKAVSVCTPQQAKRFRWRKGPKQSKKNKQASTLSRLESFAMIRPCSDKESFGLATSILEHRLAVLKAQAKTKLKERHAALVELDHDKKQLEWQFRALKNHWNAWGWSRFGAENVNESTPVPRIDVEYEPVMAGTEGENSMSTSPIGQIWEGCVSSLESQTAGHCVGSRRKRRLPIFSSLTENSMSLTGGMMPHISKRALPDDEFGSLAIQKSKCWKSLLLTSDGSSPSFDVWTIVFEHFKNTRTGKTLSILQAPSATSA